MVNNPIHDLAIKILSSYLENNPDYDFKPGDVARILNESILFYKVAEKGSNFAAARVNGALILNEDLLDNNGWLNDEGIFAVAHEGAHFLRKFENNSFIDEGVTQSIALRAVEKYSKSIGKDFVEHASYVPHTITVTLLSSLVGAKNIKNDSLYKELGRISSVDNFGEYFDRATKRAHSFYHACKWAEKTTRQ